MDTRRSSMRVPDDDEAYPSAGSAYAFTLAGKDLDHDGLCDTFWEPGAGSFRTDAEEIHVLPGS